MTPARHARSCTFGYIQRLQKPAQKTGMRFAAETHPNGRMVHPQILCIGHRQGYYARGKVYGRPLFQKLLARCAEEKLTRWGLTPGTVRPDAPELF